MTTKKEKQKLEKASRMLRTLSHPLRMAMVDMLIREKKMSVTQIHEELHIEQAIASQHLAVLKKCGIVDLEKEGKNCFYYLSQPLIQRIIDLVKTCETC